MVMDVRDVLNHDTRFDEFILLSGDADFTPVLHRLRAHARRTVVFANDHTAAPYTAIADGEVREVRSRSRCCSEGRISDESEPRVGGAARADRSAELDVVRKEIVAEVVASVRAGSAAGAARGACSTAPCVRSVTTRRLARLGVAPASFRDLLAKGFAGDGASRRSSRPTMPMRRRARSRRASRRCPEPREPRSRAAPTPRMCRQTVRPRGSRRDRPCPVPVPTAGLLIFAMICAPSRSGTHGLARLPEVVLRRVRIACCPRSCAAGRTRRAGPGAAGQLRRALMSRAPQQHLAACTARAAPPGSPRRRRPSRRHASRLRPAYAP